MANPNRTVAAHRNRKSVVTEEHIFNTQSEAYAWVATQKGKRTRVTRFAVGAYGTRQFKFAGRVYEKV